MEDNRPDPELLLEKIKKEEEKRNSTRGTLKIFLGYAAGVGKTYAMLEDAHIAAENGTDVAAGYIENHARPETLAMQEGLEMIPPLIVPYKGIGLREFDLDEALKRKPALLLVDELAHTNAEGLRHRKRYQDIEELLNAGISVYTTVNIQHLESLNDRVGFITGIQVKERIPDSVFDRADQVEVIDIEPDDLLKRLKEGKIYKKAQADRALENFFAREKLIALREIALRRTADRVNHLAIQERGERGNKSYYTGEHVMTCISPSPTCARVIRSASRLAYAFNGEFTALYVETPGLQQADVSTKKMLEENISLARALGAKIATVYGEDIACQIAEYAKVGNVSKVVLGRTNHRILLGQTRRTLTDQISQRAPNLDIYIIPDTGNTGRKKYVPGKPDRGSAADNEGTGGSAGGNLLKIAAVLGTATGIGMIFQRYHISESNIIMVYLLGVVVLSMYIGRRLYSTAASLLSVLLFNYFFTEPYYSMHAYDPVYPLTFVIMFAVAFIISTLMTTVRRQSAENAKTAWRTEILLENSQKLRRARTREDVLREVSGRIIQLMNLSVIIYLKKDGRVAGPWMYPARERTKQDLEKLISSKEKSVAEWVIRNGRRAGCCTHTLPDADAIYLPVKSSDQVFAAVGIVLEEKREISPPIYGLVAAMLNESALVFDRFDHMAEREKMACPGGGADPKSAGRK